MKDAFIEYLREQLGSIYVWGGQGEYADREFIRRKETSDRNAERAIALYEKRLSEGEERVRAFDCSGLITRFLLDEGLIPRDITANGLYELCSRISRDGLVTGDLVFRHSGRRAYHVGVYTGDGNVIEAYGRDRGVISRDIDASGESYWNRYGRLPVFADADADASAKPAYPAEYSYTGATYVNLRTAPDDMTGSIVGNVQRGESVIVLSAEDGWADVIKRQDGGLIRGFCIFTHFDKI